MKSGGYSAAAPFKPSQFCRVENQPERMALLGEKFEIEGKTYRLVQTHTVCLADVIESNHVLYYASENIVTNVLAESFSGGACAFAGIAPALDASVPESLAGETYWMLVQEPVHGDFATVRTNGDDDIAAGVHVVCDSATDAVCDSYLVDPAAAGAPSDAELQEMQLNTSSHVIGTAAADDDDTADTVLVMFV